MRDTREVREALLEMSKLLTEIAQSRLNAIPVTENLEELTMVSRATGIAEAATFLRNVHDALTESDFVPKVGKHSARVFLN